MIKLRILDGPWKGKKVHATTLKPEVKLDKSVYRAKSIKKKVVRKIDGKDEEFEVLEYRNEYLYSHDEE